MKSNSTHSKVNAGQSRLSLNWLTGGASFQEPFTSRSWQKILSVLLWILTFNICGTPSLYAQTNIVNNGGFSSLAFWTRSGGTGFGWYTAGTRTGAAAANFDDNTANARLAQTVTGLNQASVGGHLTLTFDMKMGNHDDNPNDTRYGNLGIELDGVNYATLSNTVNIGNVLAVSGDNGASVALSRDPYVFNNNCDFPGNSVGVTIDIPWVSKPNTADLAFVFSATGDDVLLDNVSILIQPLPVKLTAFSVDKEGTATQLTWSTTEETDSDHFKIQRSTDGKQWSELGTLLAAKESNTPRQYSFTDSSPLKGSNLYRLKMVDLNGTFAYSHIASVIFGEGLPEFFAEVYPNPVSNLLNIHTANPFKVKRIEMIDMKGIKVYVSPRKVPMQVNVENLSTGLYVVHVTGEDGFLVQAKSADCPMSVTLIQANQNHSFRTRMV